LIYKYNEKKAISIFPVIRKISKQKSYQHDMNSDIDEKGTLKATEQDKYENIAGSV
jgi:hypothetical protein